MPLAARVAAWAAEGQLDALAALEALADTRLSPPGEPGTSPGEPGTSPGEPGTSPGLPAARLLQEAAALVPGGSTTSLADELATAGAVVAGDLLRLPPAAAAEARPALAAAAAARAVGWSREPLTQGALLAHFAAYCRDELDDVELLEDEAGRLLLGWRDELTRVELRCSALFAERLAGGPWVLLVPVDDALVERFLAGADLRGRVSAWDVTTLTKLATVRSSVGVQLEWFLRDVYRVKVLPAHAFTEGLLARGIISLGM